MKSYRRSRSGRVSEDIARRIKKAISEGRLQPGERLVAEREMAQRLNASRVSIREAYRSLEESGLIYIKRGADGGAFIADIDHAPVSRSLSLMLRLGRTSHEELTEARLLLEPPIARLAARRAGPEDIRRLEDLVDKQEQSLKGNGNPRSHDLMFHRLVAQSAKNLPLTIVMNSVADLMLEAIAPIDISKPAKRHTLKDHRTIFDAIRRRDEPAAYEAMLRHVQGVQARIAGSFARQLRDKRRRPRKRARPARARF